MERSVVVPDRTFAFKNLVGSAVIGKTVDLETLVDLDKLLRIARVGFSSIQFLGGLFILISFPDAPAASSFVDDRKIGGPWFDKLEIWSGQTLPPERVAWLKLHGIPLNLMEADVFMQIGDLFGKVLLGCLWVTPTGITKWCLSDGRIKCSESGWTRTLKIGSPIVWISRIKSDRSRSLRRCPLRWLLM
ncbi:hypothetical protein HanHA300_Chr15g0551671 [Helianthus annuus]|nr:hypothetical protein HanHA300_Chr15g0551671 [Helianthus annuus]